jgi:hypothetical protein
MILLLLFKYSHHLLQKIYNFGISFFWKEKHITCTSSVIIPSLSIPEDNDDDDYSIV